MQKLGLTVVKQAVILPDSQRGGVVLVPQVESDALVSQAEDGEGGYSMRKRRSWCAPACILLLAGAGLCAVIAFQFSAARPTGGGTGCSACTVMSVMDSHGKPLPSAMLPLPPHDFSSPLLGESKCHTFAEAQALVKSNDGHWPGVDDCECSWRRTHGLRSIRPRLNEH